MTKASSKEYINLSDEKTKNILSVLKEFKYTETELQNRVCPYVAQWLYSLGISIESTCLIISEIVNISPIEKKIEQIYRGEFPPIAKSQLSDFLTKKEYSALEEVIEKKQLKVIRGELDDNTNVVTNFEYKQVFQEKIKHNKQSGKQERTFTPVIEAIPTEVVVYDSPITEQARTFKITWESNHSDRKFSIAGESMGATLPEISDYLKGAAFSYNPKLLDITLACMINSLIDSSFAEIKTTIDNRGIYLDTNNEKLIPVKLEFTYTSDEMMQCIEVLNELIVYFIGNEATFASVIKWSVMSIFSYAMKQAGNWLPYLYLKGSAGSGKTTLAQIGIYIYDVPSSENNMGGSSFNSEYRIGLNLSRDCTLRVVNEPATVFTRDAPRELIKVSVESITCRKVQGKIYPAFSPVIFTANQYLPDDDALLRRMYVISFTHNQRKTDVEKDSFKKSFHVNTPTLSKLKILQVLGKFAIQYVLADPSVLYDDWQKTADSIINAFYDEADVLIPGWFNTWAETETLDDYDVEQKEEIRNFFIREFNNARRKITFRDENGFISNPHITTDEDNSLRDVCWGIVNERMFSWAIPHLKRDKSENICLTQSFKTMLNKDIGYSNNLKSLAELLDWEYCQVKFGDNNLRVIEVDFDDFMDFVYPTAEGSGVDEWY